MRPLMLVHGLADDNVVAAHTLRLSSALLAAGRPHQVLPLSGVTHMTPQEVVAENLLRLQVAFLKESLGRGLSESVPRVSPNRTHARCRPSTLGRGSGAGDGGGGPRWMRSGLTVRVRRRTCGWS